MAVNNPYTPCWEKFTKTKEFSYLAAFFKENGSYTFLPKGSYEYKQFWQKVHSYCLEGFTNSAGITITGDHFFYLNFVQILMKNEETGKKSKGFPRFLDIDFEYFWLIEYCRKNQKGLILVKPRRLGFSYKAASLVTREFCLFRDSNSIIGGFLSTYSQSTMNMVLENLNFINAHTEFKKERNPDLKDHVKARFLSKVDGANVWKGYNSEVRSITFKDNPMAAVGKSSNLFILEEAGAFDNIINSYNYSEPIIKDGDEYTGICICYGSAGSMEGGTIHFYEMFTSPGKYNMLEFEDPFINTNKVGWFVSAARGRFGTYKGQLMVDEDGNSNEELAKENILRYRETKKGGLNYHAYHDSVTQYPLDYKEAFLRSKANIMPVLELAEHLGKLETTKQLRDLALPVELYFDADNKLQYRINSTLEPIINYPLQAIDNKTGCIVMWEPPQLSIDGSPPPYGLYISGVDPIDQDSSGTDSLGSCIIYKTFISAGQTYNQIVAEYTGRPNTANEFYENSRRLLLLYNAKCLYENQLTGFKGYLQEKNCLYLLAETPTYQLSKIIPDSKVNRGYGIHMNETIKDQLELYCKQWLLEERTGPNGETMLNLHTIMSIPLLKELIAYDGERNCDRAIALFCCILQLKEMHNLHVAETTTNTSIYSDSFWNKKFYQNKPTFQ